MHMACFTHEREVQDSKKNLKEREQYEYLASDEIIILNSMSKK
jgi:hypothetical protein